MPLFDRGRSLPIKSALLSCHHYRGRNNQGRLNRILQRNVGVASNSVHQPARERNERTTERDDLLSQLSAFLIAAAEIVTTHNPIPLSKVKEILRNESEPARGLLLCIEVYPDRNRGAVEFCKQQTGQRQHHPHHRWPTKKSLLLSDGPPNEHSPAFCQIVVRLCPSHAPSKGGGHGRFPWIRRIDRDGAAMGPMNVGAFYSVRMMRAFFHHLCARYRGETTGCETIQTFKGQGAKESRPGQKANIQDSIPSTAGGTGRPGPGGSCIPSHFWWQYKRRFRFFVSPYDPSLVPDDPFNSKGSKYRHLPLDY
jgi:hypothetical protein